MACVLAFFIGRPAVTFAFHSSTRARVFCIGSCGSSMDKAAAGDARALAAALQLHATFFWSSLPPAGLPRGASRTYAKLALF
jgi:hypothetical protein